MKEKIDFNKIGGAVFMGLEKIVIKAHGASDRDCITKCVMQATEAVDKGVVEAIKQGISQLDLKEE
jgi:glycerol-3-phosphate acyltransferase PlsX